MGEKESGGGVELKLKREMSIVEIQFGMEILLALSGKSIMSNEYNTEG